ncbi:MAG: ATP-binding protein, partial [Chloroflexota bacterium]
MPIRDSENIHTGGGSHIAGSVNTQGGDFVARDKVIINITGGIEQLPTRYESRVQNFLEYYLGSPQHPAPFGGRARDLEALDGWLSDSGNPRYALLAAPAGRGKSALLAHWVHGLSERQERVRTVYFPISIRFNTNLESVVFSSLAARLAHLHGEPVLNTSDVQQYRSLFSEYLRRPLPGGERLLVVLDGLDEAAGWQPAADLFPHEPPEHLRVLAAARLVAGDPEAAGWLACLGWDRPGKACRLPLGQLDHAGVADILAKMGNPLDRLAAKIDMVARLYELSQGDPLLVRLYVEALLPHGEEAAAFSLAQLANVSPGLKAYFDLWFKQQEDVWKIAGETLDEDALDAALNLLALALGPLTPAAMLDLAPQELKNSRSLGKTLRLLGRFVVGEPEGGYVFSHPRLAEYFAGQLPAKEKQAWEQRFLGFGRQTLEALTAGQMRAVDAPPYAVRYYGAHLEKMRAHDKDFYALVCEPWLRAWEAVEGTPSGFLNDVSRAWKRAEAAGAAGIGQQVRALLCFSSVVSLGVNVPSEILVQCLKAGIISPALSLVMARQKPDITERCQCLVELVPHLPPGPRQTALVEAIEIAGNPEFYRGVDTLLAALAPYLPEELFEMAIRLARGIQNDWNRSYALSELAAHLPDQHIFKALEITANTDSEYQRSIAIRSLAPRLPDSLLADALAVTVKIDGESLRAHALAGLAPYLSGSLLSEALEAVKKIGNGSARAAALEALAGRLETPQLDEALKIAGEIE